MGPIRSDGELAMVPFTLLTWLFSGLWRSSANIEPRTPPFTRFEAAIWFSRRVKDSDAAEVIEHLEGGYIIEECLDALDTEISLRRRLELPSLLCAGLVYGIPELQALYEKLGYTPYYDFKSSCLIKELKSLIRGSRPTDLKAFTELLDELEEIFRGRALEPEMLHPLVKHPEMECERILEKIARVREDLRREDGNLEDSLFGDPYGSLAERVKYTNDLGYDNNAEKKRELDSLLENLIGIRLRRSEKPWRVDFRGETAKLGKKYLDSSWMHTPWLTSFVLTNLLDADLAPLFPPDWTFPKRLEDSLEQYTQHMEWVMPQDPSLRRIFQIVMGGSMVLGLGVWLFAVIMGYIRGSSDSDLEGMVWTGLLMFFLPIGLILLYYKWRWYRTKNPRLLGDVRDEVASGQYDGEEIARRLRQHEKKGIFVHSLAYALIRLHSHSSVKLGSQ